MSSDLLGPIDYARIYSKYGQILLLATIFVDNGLDQDVTVQIKANRIQSLTNSVNVDTPFVAYSGKAEARTLTPDTSGWLPYLTVSLVCSTAPTSGSVSVYLLRPKFEEVKIVDSLEIRDTAIHDASSDSDKIFVVGWLV
jgi:hypothetical protein